MVNTKCPAAGFGGKKPPVWKHLLGQARTDEKSRPLPLACRLRNQSTTRTLPNITGLDFQSIASVWGGFWGVDTEIRRGKRKFSCGVLLFDTKL
jgi:hypothetical protein